MGKKEEQWRWERGGRGEREERRGKEKAATSSSVYRTRKGSSQQEENKDPNKQEKSKQKVITTGFYVVLTEAIHKKVGSVQGKHPTALRSCFTVFLHQCCTEILPKKQSCHRCRPPVQGPCTTSENAKTLQGFSILLKKNPKAE